MAGRRPCSAARWRLDRLETGRESLHGTARTRRRPQLDPQWTEVAWPRATGRLRRHNSPAVARGRQRQASLGEKERRRVRNTRAQLARAEKARSNEDGVAASSARPTMAAASAFGVRECQRASEGVSKGGVGNALVLLHCDHRAQGRMEARWARVRVTPGFNEVRQV
jgi:hypothetical protein